MPALAFASNFLWVMVIGLLGPSLPAIRADLGIGYAQAGFFFTLLSLGSLLGTTMGAAASDRLPRKALYAGCAAALAAGLLSLAFMPGYASVALAVFLTSALGSPVGAVGQSIMLDLAPEKRERNLSVMTSFAAAGSFLAPMLITLNTTVSLGWRWPLRETAVLAFLLFLAVMTARLPARPGGPRGTGFLEVARNPRVASTAVLIFFSVAVDLGFSYWLAEYFKTELHVSLRLASSVVGFYLAGLGAGRLLVPIFLRRARAETVLPVGLAVALASLAAFLSVPHVPVKVALCAAYGFGVGPVFPLLMARGTREYPTRSGAVTGVLFGSVSLGGMVFPLLVGSLAARTGIARSFLFCGAVAGGMLLVLALQGRRARSGGS